MEVSNEGGLSGCLAPFKAVWNGVKAVAGVVFEAVKEVGQVVWSGAAALASDAADVILDGAAAVGRVAVEGAKVAVAVAGGAVNVAIECGSAIVEGIGSAASSIASTLCFWCGSGRRLSEQVSPNSNWQQALDVLNASLQSKVNDVFAVAAWLDAEGQVENATAENRTVELPPMPDEQRLRRYMQALKTNLPNNESSDWDLIEVSVIQASNLRSTWFGQHLEAGRLRARLRSQGEADAVASACIRSTGSTCEHLQQISALLS